MRVYRCIGEIGSTKDAVCIVVAGDRDDLRDVLDVARQTMSIVHEITTVGEGARVVVEHLLPGAVATSQSSRRADRLRRVIDWALGSDGDFPMRRPDDGQYYWRE